MKWWNPKTWRQRKPEGQRVLEKTTLVDEHFEVRRFDAARTNRLNRAHWLNAHGRGINTDLQDLPSLMARCDHEATNNPIVFGALETLETDIVGRRGPKLQVISKSNRFNERVEQAWRNVWEMPDPTGRLAGPENLRLWVRLLNVAGSYVNVFGEVNRPGPVTFGWTTVHPRRLLTPPELAGTENTAFGITFNDSGRPITYHLAKRRGAGKYTENLHATETQAFPAELVQHRFVADEPEQITGYPALTPCLETVADLREYDRHVMQAAKNAAAHAVGLEAWSPESVIDPDPMPTTNYEIEPGQVNVAPLGWKWASMQATQPTAQYRDFRHERLRELGLALGMPLMMVLLSSADSNFASAHYDGAVYLRRIRAMQSWIERRTLNELLDQVIVELAVAGRVVRPSDYSLRWTWETPPYVNPEKQRKADRMAVEDGAMPLDEYSASLGFEWDEVLAARERIHRELISAGLPTAPVNYGSGRPADTLREVADELEDEDANSPATT